MGREPRMVSAEWQHPKDENGFIPLHESENESRPAWEIALPWVCLMLFAFAVFVTVI